MRLAKRIIRKIIISLFGRGIIVFLKNAIILGKNYGQYNAANTWACVNAEGLPIPWYTYPAIEYLENLKLEGLRILEYGSGNSSLYYLRRGAEVTAVEDNREWYEKIKTENKNCSFKYVYTESVQKYINREEVTSVDLIVIDGSHRPACTDYVISKIKEGHNMPAMIIFDDSDSYPKSIGKLDKQTGWIRVDFCGFSPLLEYTSITSIFLNPSKILPRIGNHITSVAGTGDNAEP